MTATAPLTSTRWSLRRDLPEMAAVEQACGGNWTEEDFLARLRERNCVGMSAVCEDAVTGFVVYELHAGSLRMLRFGATDPHTAERLLAKVLYKLNSHRRQWLEVSWRDAVQMRDAVTYEPASELERIIFRDLPVIPPAWLSDNVRWMCKAEHYPCLPILADALEDTGCDDAGLLSLLRADGNAGALVYEELRERLMG